MEQNDNNFIHINSIDEYQKYSMIHNNFIIYVYSILISGCKELLQDNKIINLFCNKKIKLFIIDANKNISLITLLGISLFPIFLIYKNNFKINEINGNIDNIFECLQQEMSKEIYIDNNQMSF